MLIKSLFWFFLNSERSLWSNSSWDSAGFKSLDKVRDEISKFLMCADAERIMNRIKQEDK